MWKVLLLVSLLPIVVVVLVRRWRCDRILRSCQGHMTNRSGRELAEGVFKASGHGDLITVEVKRRAGVQVSPPCLILSRELAEGKEVVSLAEVAALAGQVLVAVGQPELVNWRQWVVRFSWAFPIFTTVVVIFAVVVAKVGASWGVVIVLGALAIASSLSLVSVMVESEGSKLARDLLGVSRVLPRRDDEEEVQRCCRAFAYRRVVPGAIEWMMGDPRK